MDFVPRLVPFNGSQQYVSPYWLAPACKQIDEIIGPRLAQILFAFSAPRDHAKTSLIQAAIVLHLLRWPHEKIAYFCHGEKLALTRSKEVRRACRGLGFKFSEDSDAAADWELETGAGLRASPITSFEHGRHYRLVIIDDPFRNADEARTANARERVIDAIESDVMPSLSPDGAIILTHSRQHPLDTIGHYSKAKDQGWRYLNIPAIATSPRDPLGRKIGEPLWVERYPLTRLLDIQRKNPNVFETQYQGEPRTTSGTLFKEPARFNLRDFRPEKYKIAYGYDCAYSDNSQKRRDWSAIVKMARVLGPKPSEDLYYVLEVRRMQVNAVDFIDELKRFWKTERGPMLWFRAGGPEQGVADLIRSKWAVPRSLAVGMNGKYARSVPVSEAWNQGRVLVPGSSTDEYGDFHPAPEWVDDFLSETENFTGTENGVNDDQVDALSAGFYQLDSAPSLSGITQPSADTFSGVSRFSSLPGRGFG